MSKFHNSRQMLRGTISLPPSIRCTVRGPYSLAEPLHLFPILQRHDSIPTTSPNKHLIASILALHPIISENRTDPSLAHYAHPSRHLYASHIHTHTHTHTDHREQYLPYVSDLVYGPSIGKGRYAISLRSVALAEHLYGRGVVAGRIWSWEGGIMDGVVEGKR